MAVIFNDEARSELKKGVDILANAVKVTLGPKGRNVIINKEYGVPHITKDGVSVAKAIKIENSVQNIGAELVKEVAAKTAEDAGDGTTTATVLAQSIINFGLKSVAFGSNPMDIKKGIDKAVSKVLEVIKNCSEEVTDANIKNIATISANNDEEIGSLISNMILKVGRNGVITLDEAKGTKTTTEIISGIQFDRGYLSPYFINNPDQKECILENPYVLIYDDKLDNIKEIINLLTGLSNQSKPLFLIVNDIEDAALEALAINHIKGTFKICVVKAPGFGYERKELLKDIAALSGCEIFSKQRIPGLTNLGVVTKITINKFNTIIANTNPTKILIDNRIEEIEEQIKSNKSNKERLQIRLAKLTSGIGVIHVGATSEVEMREKKDRIEDALCAVRAAIEEGIVPGGGSTYIEAYKQLSDIKGNNTDEDIGISIIKDALKAPLTQICNNAGINSGVIINNIITNGEGYDAKNDRYGNLLEFGIIDPAKVTRVALENAASIASMFLTTECVVDCID